MHFHCHFHCPSREEPQPDSNLGFSRVIKSWWYQGTTACSQPLPLGSWAFGLPLMAHPPPIQRPSRSLRRFHFWRVAGCLGISLVKCHGKSRWREKSFRKCRFSWGGLSETTRWGCTIYCLGGGVYQQVPVSFSGLKCLPRPFRCLDCSHTFRPRYA